MAQKEKPSAGTLGRDKKTKNIFRLPLPNIKTQDVAREIVRLALFKAKSCEIATPYTRGLNA